MRLLGALPWRSSLGQHQPWSRACSSSSSPSGWITRSSVSRKSLSRRFSSAAAQPAQVSAAQQDSSADHSHLEALKKIRNFGISAHIDSGKTTLTERILFYTGRIREIHDVKGKSGVGAKMDHMDLEREKGITICSAATYASWEGADMNIIDTPGHVDFTIEVERSLRVLDGAIMVCCAVGGVQAQTKTVHRQMVRYDVPRVVFVNKMDRYGADPVYVMQQIREKLGLCVARVQVPIGAEDKHEGVVDIIRNRAVYFEGDQGVNRKYTEVPKGLKDDVAAAREELIETLADLDDDVAEAYLEGGECSAELLHTAIRRQVLARKFCPLLMGSAYKNKGVQELLDAVTLYLPSPLDRLNKGVNTETDEEVLLAADPKAPLIAYGFKIQDLPKIGTLTYLRIYQGVLKSGAGLYDVMKQKRVSPKKLLRMHSAEVKDLDYAVPGDIVAITGVECQTGTTFTQGPSKIACTSMYVPDPVMSLSVKLSDVTQGDKFGKGTNRFRREDPTFHLDIDPDTKEMVMRGMGELHLEIYVERLKREFGVTVETGEPLVNYRETITQKVDYEYQYKKQSGGRGQFARILGYFEPVPEEEQTDNGENVYFRSDLTGNDIPPTFVPSIGKGFMEAAAKGALAGYPMVNVRFVVNDGKAHDVDSSDLSFREAAKGAVDTFVHDAQPVVLEPKMKVDIVIPTEHQAAVLMNIATREGTVLNTSAIGHDATLLEVIVPLRAMFGYAKDLRSLTAGQGEFTMDFAEYVPMPAGEQQKLADAYKLSRMSEAELLLKEREEKKEQSKKDKYG